MSLSDLLRCSRPPALVIGALVAACSNTPASHSHHHSTGSGGGGGGVQVSPDGIAMTAEPVTQTTEIQSYYADDGTRFAVVSFTFGNSTKESLSLAHVLFKVRTSGSLDILADPVSADVPNPCPENTLVAPGGSYACTLVFQVPDQQDPVALNYTSPDGLKGSAGLVLLPCEWCDPITCSDLQTSTDNCGKCNNPVPKCVNGAPVCDPPLDSCGGTQCINLSSDDNNCGSCGTVCPVSPPSMFNNCTEQGPCTWCGCSSGKCRRRLETTQLVSCATLCQMSGLTCMYGGTTVYGTTSDYPCGNTTSCAQVPPSTLSGQPYKGISCECFGM